MLEQAAVIAELLDAEKKAFTLFDEAVSRGLIIAGKTERELNSEMYQLAEELLGVKKFWHKRIVRAGANTLFPYRENPPDLILQEDDILFFDFGPVFEDWEADIGKTFVIGGDIYKYKLQRDTELAWKEGQTWFLKNPSCTGSEFYQFTTELAKKYGWEFGGEHCGHLIGKFPHEKIEGESRFNYIHPENHESMSKPGIETEVRRWIYEIHLVDREKGIGGFYEAFVGPF
jgi:Xaa-Pro dipeptidase